MRTAVAQSVNKPSDIGMMSGPTLSVATLFASIATGSLARYVPFQPVLGDFVNMVQVLALLAAEVWATSDV